MLRVGRQTVIPGDFMGVRTFAPRSAAAAASWWMVAGKACVCAYAPKGAASYAASLSNLANPETYDAAEGTAPSWSAGTGWTFDGSTEYLTTGVTPSSGYSIIVRFSGGTVSGLASKCVVGSSGTGSTRLFMHNWHSAFNSAIWGGGGIYTAYGAGIEAGVMGLANQACYVDGTSVGNTSAAWSGSGFELYIGARNTSGSVAEFFSGAIQALAIYSDTLSTPELATVSAAMAAL